jgi:signal recognition particle receptor subunit beta
MFPALSMPYMAVLVSLFIVVLTLFFIMRRRSLLGSLSALKNLVPARKHTVLICGPVDSGKTVLFHTLSGGKYQPTRTSIEENVGTFKINPELLKDRKKELCDIQFEFIDFPGHPSQELKLGKFINNIQSVILLTDASSSDSISRASKMLFALLEKKGFMKKQIPILICANKSDLGDAQTMTAIRSRILDELNTLRESRTTMETIDKVDEGIEPVGKSGDKLTWENLGCTVSFGQISAKEGNVRDVLDFLETTQCCC